MVTAPAQPWMRNTVLNKFGRTMPKVWKTPSNKLNPYKDMLRDDGNPIPIKERIRFWKLARGDRVVVVRGEHKGAEGVIKAIDPTRNGVIVDGVAVEERKLPKSLRMANDPNLVPMSIPFKYQDLRLVYDLPRKQIEKWQRISKTILKTSPDDHPEGKWRVVIEKLVVSRPFRDPKTGRESFNRMIPGINFTVPWPKRSVTVVEKRDARILKSLDPLHFPDTPTATVVKKTFDNPTLAYPPLPAGIERELHNPNSWHKKVKFALAKQQLWEWKLRYDPQEKENEALRKAIEKKDQNIYTPEQLRIRAANKLVRKARVKFFKRRELADADAVLIAGYMKTHIEGKMAELAARGSVSPLAAPVTPLENAMSVRARLRDRRRREAAEAKMIAERKAAAEKAWAEKEKNKGVHENKGRHKVFEFKASVKPPIRKKGTRKKKKKTYAAFD